MKRFKQIVIVLAVGILGMLSFTVMANAKRGYLHKVDQIRLTKKYVFGRTTPGSKIKIMNKENKILGRAVTSKDGRFSIKVRNDLRRRTFLFNLTKKGYFMRWQKHKPKKTLVQKRIEQEIKKAENSVAIMKRNRKLAETARNTAGVNYGVLQHEIYSKQGLIELYEGEWAQSSVSIINELKDSVLELQSQLPRSKKRLSSAEEKYRVATLDWEQAQKKLDNLKKVLNKEKTKSKS